MQENARRSIDNRATHGLDIGLQAHERGVKNARIHHEVERKRMKCKEIISIRIKL